MGQRVVVLTPSPSRVQEELTVDLPMPRDQVTTKELPEFTRLRGHVYRSIRRRDEPARGLAAGAGHVLEQLGREHPP